MTISKIILGFLTVVTAWLCLQLFRKTRGASLLVWHVTVLVLVMDVAAFFLEQIVTEYRGLDLPYDNTTVERIITSLMLVSLVGIVYLSVFRWKVRHTPMTEDRVGDSRRVVALSGSSPFYWFGVALAFFGVFVYFSSARAQLTLAYLGQVLGDYSDYYMLRYDAGRIATSLSGDYINIVSVLTALPLITLYSLQRWLLEGNKVWFARWAVLLMLWILISIVLLSKAPLTTVVLSNLAVWIMTSYYRQGRIPSIRVVISVVLIVFLVNALLGLLGATEDLFSTVAAISDRFVVNPMITTYAHYLVFPDLHSHTYWASSRTFNFFLAGGFHPVSDTQLLSFQIASAILTGTAFNMNTGVIGSGWADLGYLGVVQSVSLTLLPFLLWDLYFAGRVDRIYLVPLVAYFLGRIYNILNLGMGFMLIGGGAILAPIFYLALLHFERRKQDTRAVSLAAESRLPYL